MTELRRWLTSMGLDHAILRVEVCRPRLMLVELERLLILILDLLLVFFSLFLIRFYGSLHL